MLNPRSSWDNADDYDKQATTLGELFINNFKTYGKSVSYLEHAGPIRKHNEIAI